MSPDEKARRKASRPLVGVGAVLLSERLDRVLLVLRGTEPAAGKWSVPGGLVERGEPLIAACAREVLEETGLTAQLQPQPIKLLQRVIADDHGEVTYHYLIVDFVGRAEDNEPVAGSDVRQARWFDIDHLPRLDTTAGLAQVIARAIEIARCQTPSSPLLE